MRQFAMKNHSRTVAANLMTSIATRSSWSRAWMRSPAVNCLSKKPFRGINRLTLTLAAAREGWNCNRWGTDAQWSKKGFTVPRGTPATRILSMVEATTADTVYLRYGAKRITMVKPHDEFAAIQAGDDDTWHQIQPDMARVIDLVGAAFGGRFSLSVPDLSEIKSNDVATKNEQYCSHLCRAALRLTIETQMLPLLPEDMTDPDIIGLAAEIGTAFLLNDCGMVPERIRDQPTVRRWSALMIGQSEVAVFAAGLAQHAIDRMSAAAVADKLPATIAA
jgi:hypothetical protein